DWYASFANLIGYKIKSNEAPDSQNNLKTLLGENIKNRDFVVEQNLQNVLGIVIGDWKYIEPSKFAKMNKETNTEMGNNPKPQLYNLKSDPGETTNLADKYPEKVAEFKNKLDKVKNK
ncbi:MAG: arylsulfatase, partial [Paludibacter sp.]